MKIKTMLITGTLLLVLSSTVQSQTKTENYTVYNKNYQVEKHVQGSGGNYTIRDKNYRVQGYIRGDKIYDKNFHQKGSYQGGSKRDSR